MMGDLSLIVRDSGRRNRILPDFNPRFASNDVLDVCRTWNFIEAKIRAARDQLTVGKIEFPFSQLYTEMSTDINYKKFFSFFSNAFFDKYAALKLFSRLCKDGVKGCSYSVFDPHVSGEITVQTRVAKKAYGEEVPDKVRGPCDVAELVYYKREPFRRENKYDVAILVSMLKYFSELGVLEIYLFDKLDSMQFIDPSNLSSSDLLQRLIDGRFVVYINTDKVQSCYSSKNDKGKTRFLLYLLEWVEWRFGAFVHFDHLHMNSSVIYRINDIGYASSCIDKCALVCYWIFSQIYYMDVSSSSEFLTKYDLRIPLGIDITTEPYRLDILNTNFYRLISKLHSGTPSCSVLKIDNYLDTVPAPNNHSNPQRRMELICSFIEQSVSGNEVMSDLVEMMRNLMRININAERGGPERTVTADQIFNDNSSLENLPTTNSTNGTNLMPPVLEANTAMVNSEVSNDKKTVTTVLVIASIVAALIVLTVTGLLSDFITMTGMENWPIIGKPLRALADMGNLRRQKFRTPILIRDTGSYDYNLYDNLYSELRLVRAVKVNNVTVKVQDYDMLGSCIHIKADDVDYYSNAGDLTAEGTIILYCHYASPLGMGFYNVATATIETLTNVEASLFKLSNR